jgi:radical SAM enzyme (TIGR01210 family)
MHYRPEYPDAPAARDRFVIDLRGPRQAHDPWRYQNVLVEDEPTETGDVARVGTVFLTGRECPWRCAMCDLWRHTTRADTPAGAIPAQIAAARRLWQETGEAISRLKLYNASNFFDPRAVPPGDYGDIAAATGEVEQVIVESHPALVGNEVERFLDSLSGRRLEVAMGLETVHPSALEALNKKMTTDDFARAARALDRLGASLRVFLLIAPPFVPRDEQDDWLLASVRFAEQCGASVISLIPTRGGNGAMEALTAQKLFQAPTADDVQRSFDLVLNRLSTTDHRPPRILLDPWAAHAR